MKIYAHNSNTVEQNVKSIAYHRKSLNLKKKFNTSTFLARREQTKQLTALFVFIDY